MIGISYEYGSNTYFLGEDGNVYNITKWKEGNPRPKPLKWCLDNFKIRHGFIRMYDGHGNPINYSTQTAKKDWFKYYGEELKFEWEANSNGSEKNKEENSQS